LRHQQQGDIMRFSPVSLVVAISGAFALGLFLSPVAQHLVGDAHAQAAPLQPMMIDLAGLKHADIPTTPNKEMNARGLVTTDNATVGIQSGNVAKHIHPKTDEIQYIIEGSGSMWLGNERKEFKPGTLIIIPKGTPHAGSMVTNGPVKALAIKIPPQPKDDITFVQ
jgi:mannose-6-phosphate isomerase-like protein (cupin superfamily)